MAYKKDVEDYRESPALKVMDLLVREEAAVEYHDPHVPSFNDDKGRPWHSFRSRLTKSNAPTAC